MTQPAFWPTVWHRRQWWRPFATASEYHEWVEAGMPPECECREHHGA